MAREDQAALDALGYEADERTRFSLRYEVFGDSDHMPSVRWHRTLFTLTEAQRLYVRDRDASGLGASGFGAGFIFDQFGQEVAQISYNGRLWPPLPWTSQSRPVAEAPQA